MAEANMDVQVRAQLAYEAIMERKPSDGLPLDGALVLSYVVWPDKIWPDSDRAVRVKKLVEQKPSVSFSGWLPPDTPRPMCECHGLPMHVNGRRRNTVQYICPEVNREKYARYAARKAAKKAERG